MPCHARAAFASGPDMGRSSEAPLYCHEEPVGADESKIMVSELVVGTVRSASAWPDAITFEDIGGSKTEPMEPEDVDVSTLEQALMTLVAIGDEAFFSGLGPAVPC